MNRRAIIIGNPGIEGQNGYIAGVLKDIENYYKFLLSPHGGAWWASEISILRRPSVSEVRKQVALQKMAEYSMTIFCGHGYHRATDGSSYVELRDGEDMNSVELRAGASRHSLILDSCRAMSQEILREEKLLLKASRSDSSVDTERFRRVYDKEINKCATGLVVMFACNTNPFNP